MNTILTSIQIEGNILTPDITSLLSTGNIKGQQPEDFGLVKTAKLADEIATAWGDAKAYWNAFQRKLARLPEDDTATTITREWAVSLLESLGYKPVLIRQAEEVDGQTYAISHRAESGDNKPPIHIIGCRLKLDQRPPSGTPRLSAHGLVQEYLNKTEHLWAITTNGYRWRLLRDSSLMTRLSYVEFDLEQILNSENFAEFSIFYRLFHRSRLPEGVDDADKCLLEFYHQETLQQGGRVRDKLRDGVEKALEYLGNGFLQHPSNEHLRQKFFARNSALALSGEDALKRNYEPNYEEKLACSSALALSGEDALKRNYEPNYEEKLACSSALARPDEDALKRNYEPNYEEKLACSSALALSGEDALKGNYEPNYEEKLAWSSALALSGEDALKGNYEPNYEEKLACSSALALSGEDALKRNYERNYECNYELEFYRQLLRLIYRLLFLMVAEARDLLLIGDDVEKGRIYREYYSVERLRRLAERPSYRREGFQDLWRGLCVTFKLFDENWRGQVLGLSPLNGDLFGSNTLPDIDNCTIDNYDLLQAIKYLSLYVDTNGLRRVNYASLDVEELGSVYESLLDFHPQVRVNQGIYEFRLVYGSDRKTTGSFYTPPQLVQQLIKTALEPVIQEKLARSSALAPSGEDALKRNYEPNYEEKLACSSALARPDEDALKRNYEPNYEEKLACSSALARPDEDALKRNYERNYEEKLACSSALARPDEDALKRNYERNYESSYEQALLSLKIVDPACGSGHFLLAAARRIGKELARVRTGEAEPGKEPLNRAIRDVIQNCIYGVDINPLAVDLCKVALWIEGFYRGMPLNFLDHRIKCGNSLVGVLDLEVLKEGIPDDAYKAVTGDNKTLSTQLKKRNKKEREQEGQLSLFDSWETGRGDYIENARMLGEIPETTPQEVREKQAKYEESRCSVNNFGWWRDFSACNLWTAAFFMGLTAENLQLLPTSAALWRFLRSGTFAHSEEDALKRDYELSIQDIEEDALKRDYELSIQDIEEDALKRDYELSIQKVVDAANRLGKEMRFFHWCLEFPDVFEQGGFDCVLGNPPWERIKLQEKEFFASRCADIANAANKAAREKLIQELARKNPELARAFDDAKHDAEAQSKFIRESGRFPLTAVGDINTYAVFAETMRNLISSEGRVGIIVPTGIATDDTCKRFFGDLTQKETLASLYDFENREGLFPAVDSRMKFSLLTVSGKPNKCGNFAFFLTQTRQLENQERQFQLSPQDIALLNPNTLTCPVFRTRADAELTRKIYQRVPVLENEKTGSNPWGVSFMRMFDMANDSGLFVSGNRENQTTPHSLLSTPEAKFVPLYEAKMFHQFDHRWATYTSRGDTRDVRDEEKCNLHYQVQPRYWVSRDEVENKLAGKWDKKWLLGFRDICRSTDERTAIFSLLPRVGVGNNAPIILTDIKEAKLVSCLLANFCSLTFDYVTRFKVGGTHMNFFIVKQLPVLPPEFYTQEDIEYISTRVLELVYTSWEMQPFALDIGYTGEPFVWNNNRRAILRAELDAYYAKLYGLTRDELRYILDPADVYGEDFPSETFRVLKSNEMKLYGEYRTRRLVLEVWDKLGF